VPALSVQPLIENAIRHGIARRLDGGKISVEAERNGTRFSLTVMNDCELSAERSADTFFRGGHALDNIRERLRLHYGDRASVTVTSPQPDAVVVTIAGPAQ
jgi:sensor histidine kinase YesM